MKQPLLLSTPATHPTKKQRLHAFMAQHGIETHRANVDWPWMAVLMPKARTLGYGLGPSSSLWECVSKVGRLLDEAGYAEYGNTEEAAVKELCRKNEIPFL